MSSRNSVDQIRNSLGLFQKSCAGLKDKINDYRKRKVSPIEKNQLDIQLKETKQQEKDLKSQFDLALKDQDSKPDLQRATLQKLSKDFERLKISFDALSTEAQLIAISTAVSSNDNFNRTGASENGGGGLNQKQQLGFKLVLHEHDDEKEIEERAQEIKKLNADLILVNDMFKEMSGIVGKQGEHVDQIHKATDTSHEQAKAGLEQVQQAANYQPTCMIS